MIKITFDKINSSSLNFEKIDDETKIDANLDELDKSGKITHDSDVYSIVNTKAEPNNQTNEPQIIEAASGGGKVIVEIEERLLNKLDKGELMLISKRMLSNTLYSIFLIKEFQVFLGRLFSTNSNFYMRPKSDQ